MFRVAIFFVAFLGLLPTAFGYNVGTFRSVTSDDSGRYLAAVNQADGVFVSSDYGATWNSTSSKQPLWVRLASDGTGVKLAASTDGGATLPFISKDEGATWTQSTSGARGVTYSSSISSDGSGDNLVLAGYDDLYISSDAGANWVPAGLKSYYSSQTIDYSADGTTIIYNHDNRIALAKDGVWLGATASPVCTWVGASTSSDGRTIAGCSLGDTQGNRGIYLSTDAGASYTALATSHTEFFYAVEVTDDGKRVFFAGDTALYVHDVVTRTTTRSDLPITESPGNFTVLSIATSRDGQYAVAGCLNAYIWTSSNYGLNWKLTFAK